MGLSSLENTYLPLINKYIYLLTPYPYVNGLALTLAHMKQESAFNPNAYLAEPLLNDGSTGLMQLLLGTANEFEVVSQSDLYDPETNIRIGMELIARNLSDYGNLTDEIAAYNSGEVYQDPGTGLYTNSQGDPNVQNYVDAVYSNYINYVSILGSSSSSVGIAAMDTGAIVAVGLLVFVGWRMYGK